MSENRHDRGDLKQMQSLSLDAKIRMTKQRIKDWYENWHRFEIYNTKTEKTRYLAVDMRDKSWDYEPPLKANEIVKAEYIGAVYVSFSGGKDSTVLKHIVDSMYDDVPSVFVNTGLEYPEIQKFAMSFDNVTTIRPEMRFDEVIKKYGYPIISKEISYNVSYARKGSEWALRMLNGKRVEKDDKYSRYNCDKWNYLLKTDFEISNQCCRIIKKKPCHEYSMLNGRMSIVGTMANESQLRLSQWIKDGCNAWNTVSPASKPLSFWTEQDIYTYILKYNVPICSAYGEIVGTMDNCEYSQETLKTMLSMGDLPKEMKLKTTGVERTGCIFCGFGAHLEKEPNRFQMLKETHPKQYNYCINGGDYDEDGLWKPNKDGLGLAHVLDTIGVKYDRA